MVRDKRNKKIAAEIKAVEKDDKVGIKMIEEEMKEVESDIQQKGVLVFVNGKRISSEALKSFFIQHSDGVTVVEVNYEEKQLKQTTKREETFLDEKPSPKGISIPKSEGPEVYTLGEDDFVKLCSMSVLRTTKEDDKNPVSKLKKVMPKEGVHPSQVEEVELKTEEYTFNEIAGMTKALNDLAVKEQKIQRNPKVIKAEEIYLKPKVVVNGMTFIITEKFKLYKVKESNEK